MVSLCITECQEEAGKHRIEERERETAWKTGVQRPLQEICRDSTSKEKKNGNHGTSRSHQLHGGRERNKIFAKFCTRLGDPHVRLYEEDPLTIDLCLKEIRPFR